jgi:hypothetical protein
MHLCAKIHVFYYYYYYYYYGGKAVAEREGGRHRAQARAI